MSKKKEQEKKGKSGRGLTECISLIKLRKDNRKLHIEFDDYGNPVGENSTQFISLLERTIRHRCKCYKVPPKHSDDWWKIVWEEIRTFFEFEADVRLRRALVKKMKKMHRDWRAKLSSFVDGSKKGLNVKDTYPDVNDEAWQLFVAKYSKKEFKPQREKAKQSAQQNEYPHNLSRGGYPKLKDRLAGEDLEAMKVEAREKGEDEDMITMEHVPKLDRARLWKEAHKRRGGDYYREGSKQVAERINQYMEQETQGSFSASGRNDILAMAIGKPEHPGRVRGVGQGIGILQYFGPPPSRPDPYTQLDEAGQRDDNDPIAELFARNASLDMNTITISLPPEITSLEETVNVGYNEVAEIISGGQEWLSVQWLQLAVEIVYKKRRSAQRDDIGFLSPGLIQPLTSPKDMMDYIILRLSENFSILLSPININVHWILVVLFPAHDTAYMLDSLHHEVQIPEHIKQAFNDAYNKIFTGVKLDWKAIEGLRQPLRYECGHYTILKMLAIVDLQLEVDELIDHFESLSRYPAKELTRVKSILAARILERMVSV